MKLFDLFARRKSAPVARERLQILLTHERNFGGESNLVGILREEILAVIAKHVTVDADKVQVKLDRRDAVSMLEIDVEIPSIGSSSAPAAEPTQKTEPTEKAA
jgi:cell division topological specificity factor